MKTTKQARHNTFYISLAVGFTLTFVTFVPLIWLNAVYASIHAVVFYWTPIRATFLMVTLANNGYQIFAHIFAATKFMGFKQVVPFGAHDNQPLTTFTLSNVLDILGWLTIFVYHGYAHPFLVLLAATHYGTGMTAMLFPKTFQEYYIVGPKTLPTTTTTPTTHWYTHWTASRVGFVTLDAVTRAFICHGMIHNLR